jgi:hypothetical protein
MIKGDTIPTDQFFVTKYLVTRHFGGREEGGWWYDRSQFDEVISRFTTEEAAFETARKLNRHAKDEKRQADGSRYQGRFSVANHTDQVYLVDRSQVGENDDTDEPRPHYE